MGPETSDMIFQHFTCLKEQLGLMHWGSSFLNKLCQGHSLALFWREVCIYVSLFNPCMSNTACLCFLIFMPPLKDLFFYIPNKAKEPYDHISPWAHTLIPGAVIKNCNSNPHLLDWSPSSPHKKGSQVTGKSLPSSLTAPLPPILKWCETKHDSHDWRLLPWSWSQGG